MIKSDNRAELLASLYLFSRSPIKIEREEFHKSIQTILDTQSHHVIDVFNGDINSFENKSLGITYYSFNVVYTVGWTGDHDCDSFYCKTEGLTKSVVSN
jgi:hypothetical protein